VGGSPEAQLSSRLRARPRAADVDVQPFNPEEIVGEDLGEDVATGSGSPLRTGTGGRVARGVSGQDHPVIELGGISIEQEFTGTPENPKWGNVTVKDLEFVNALRRFAGKQPLGEMNMEAVPAFGGHVPPSYGRK
jgi:hypothetical protein